MKWSVKNVLIFSIKKKLTERDDDEMTLHVGLQIWNMCCISLLCLPFLFLFFLVMFAISFFLFFFSVYLTRGFANFRACTKRGGQTHVQLFLWTLEAKSSVCPFIFTYNNK